MLVVLLVAALALLSAGGQSSAGAITHDVNEAGDQPDGNLLDGECDRDEGTDGLRCTLRAAIQQANQDTAKDTISFSIGSG